MTKQVTKEKEAMQWFKAVISKIDITYNFFGLADEMLLLRKVFLVKGKKCTALCLDKKKYYHRAVI
ncbi:MAG: hypothetical protein AB8B66_03865 [Rickettsiaceae bacterium]